MNSQILAALTLAEGIVFGVLAYVTFRKKSAKLARCERTWGDVIEVKERQGGDGSTRHPVIRYKTSTGEDCTFESKYGSSNWKVKTGDRLELLVEPANPTDAEVVSFMAQWGLSLIFAIISVGSVIIAPIVYLFLK